MDKVDKKEEEDEEEVVVVVVEGGEIDLDPKIERIQMNIELTPSPEKMIDTSNTEESPPQEVDTPPPQEIDTANTPPV